VANPRLVWIPPGTFTIGAAPCEDHQDVDERPQTVVTLTYGFWMGKYEATQGEYEGLMGSNPSKFTGDPNRPVENVSWAEAAAFCAKLTDSEKAAGRLPSGHAYRLPTEVEWEYACRAGTTTLFSFGFDRCTPWLDYYVLMQDYGWTAHNSDNQTHPVGQKKPNPWGLYDMHGNVWEWTLDWYGLYAGGSVIYPAGAQPTATPTRCIRGGAWHIAGYGCRVADRHNMMLSDPIYALYGSFGFRYVLAPTQP
jgi:formylglycine-generating enzyme required for sulfatase activity